MGRRPRPEIRERLLERCTDHVLAHGLPEGLASFADATQTSPRMLIYHFGTRDDLRREVLRDARRRQRQWYGALLAPRADEPYVHTLRRAWREMTGPAGRPYLALFGWLRENADELWPGFRAEATADWLGPLREGLAALGRPELATLVLAVLRGLVLDLEACDDEVRVHDAFEDFLGLLAATGPGR